VTGPRTDPGLPRVAVLGLGAMGSRLAWNLLAAAVPVTVFNRTAGAADMLVSAGARRASTPRAAAAGAGVVLACVTDDDASAAVWLHPQSGALGAAEPGATAVECSTVSPDWVRTLASAAGDAGVTFLEAPLIGSRPQADARRLGMLVGGDAQALAAVRPILATSASTVRHVGGYGAAAVLKLVVNALLATQVVTVAELLAVAGGHGLDAGTVLDVLAELPVTSPAAARAGRAIASGDVAPNFPVRLVGKDLRYLLELAGGPGAGAPMSTAALNAYLTAQDRGRGEEDLTAVAHVIPRT
jgi:3-hydroxyisobutyrate dehydrogenase